MHISTSNSSNNIFFYHNEDQLKKEEKHQKACSIPCLLKSESLKNFFSKARSYMNLSTRKIEIQQEEIDSLNSETFSESIKETSQANNLGDGNKEIVIHSKKIRSRTITDLKKELKSDTPLQEISYVDIIEKLEEEGRFELSHFYQFLFLPSRKGESFREDFRKDFLLASPWMRPVQRDLASDNPLLVCEMIHAYTGARTARQRKLIARLAVEIIQRNILPKEKLLQLLTQAAGGQNDPLMNLVGKLQNIEVKSVQSAQEIEYDFDNSAEGAVIRQFKKIADDKLSSKDKKKFIKDLAKSLTILASNAQKKIQATDLHGQAWEKRPEAAPHMTYVSFCFNQLSFFTIDQILSVQKAKKRNRLYSAINKLVIELIKRHDYHSAMALYSALINYNVTRVVDISKYKKIQRTIDKWLSPLNTPDLNKTVRHCKENAISCTPHIGNFLLSKFINAEEAISGGELNADRLRIFAMIHRDLEGLQKNLKEKTRMPYNLNLVLNPDFNMSDEEREEASMELVPLDHLLLKQWGKYTTVKR